jgi:hypothetical protein
MFPNRDNEDGKPARPNTFTQMTAEKGSWLRDCLYPNHTIHKELKSVITHVIGAGWLSWYSDWLRAGHSGHRTPGGGWGGGERDIPHPSRLALGLTQPHLQWVPVLFPGGKATGAWR